MLYFRAGLWYQFSGTGLWRRFLVGLRVSWALFLPQTRYTLVKTKAAVVYHSC